MNDNERYCFECKGWVREGCGKAYVHYKTVIIVHAGECSNNYERKHPDNVLFLG